MKTADCDHGRGAYCSAAVGDQLGLHADATGTESNRAAQMAVEESGIGGGAENIITLTRKISALSLQICPPKGGQRVNA